MRYERKALPGEWRSGGDGGAGELEGLASAFYTIDDSWWNDIIAPGAFRNDLERFLAEGFVGGLNHDWDRPIGRPVEAEETSTGLRVRAVLSDVPGAQEVRALVRDGVIRRLSIGFRVLDRRLLETPEEVAAWWAQAGYTPTEEDRERSCHGARLLTRVRLYEFSPVAVAANPGAVITGVKGAAPSEGRTLAEHGRGALAALEEWLERMEAAQALRRGEGRALSPDHRAGLRRARARLDALLEGWVGAPSPAELEREFDGLEQRLRALGVTE